MTRLQNLGASNAGNAELIAQYQSRLAQLEEELAKRSPSEGGTPDAQANARIAQLEQENARLRAAGGDSGNELTEARDRIASLEQENEKLRSVNAGESAETGIIAAYRDRIGQLEMENRRLQGERAAADPAVVQSYEKRIMQLEEELAGMRQYNGQQLYTQDTALESLRANLDEAQRAYQEMVAQNQDLHVRIEQQAREISDLENEVQGNSVKDANQRARKIIQDALEESSRILDEAEMVRSRAFAATKAAYFNALMFRQRLAEQFTNIDQSLDDSLGILRSTDMVALSPRMNMEYTNDPRWIDQSGKEGQK